VLKAERKQVAAAAAIQAPPIAFMIRPLPPQL
jgi:hypothetical protein